MHDSGEVVFNLAEAKDALEAGVVIGINRRVLVARSNAFGYQSGAGTPPDSVVSASEAEE